MSVTFNIKYKAGHSYEETWERSGWHCPMCGDNTDTWEEHGESDYYLGTQSLCLKCESYFYIPLANPVTEDADFQRIKRLKKA